MGEKLDTASARLRRGGGRGRVAGERRLLAMRGKRTVDSIHRELGQDHVGELRHGTQRRGPARARSRRFPRLRQEFRENVNVLGAGESLNQSLEKAGRVADFLELGELMCTRRAATGRSRAADISARRARPPKGEAMRDDEKFSYVAAWRMLGTTRAGRSTRSR